VPTITVLEALDHRPDAAYNFTRHEYRSCCLSWRRLASCRRIRRIMVSQPSCERGKQQGSDRSSEHPAPPSIDIINGQSFDSAASCQDPGNPADCPP
jgi:hypothetical protein